MQLDLHNLRENTWTKKSISNSEGFPLDQQSRESISYQKCQDKMTDTSGDLDNTTKPVL